MKRNGWLVILVGEGNKKKKKMREIRKQRRWERNGHPKFISGAHVWGEGSTCRRCCLIQHGIPTHSTKQHTNPKSPKLKKYIYIHTFVFGGVFLFSPISHLIFPPQPINNGRGSRLTYITAVGSFWHQSSRWILEKSSHFGKLLDIFRRWWRGTFSPCIYSRVKTLRRHISKNYNLIIFNLWIHYFFPSIHDLIC